jgi:hypothetical protein
MIAISEKAAIGQLVADGLLTADIAAILEPFAREANALIYDPASARSRILVVAIDKSSSIEIRGLTHAMIDAQHHLINSLLGATSALKIAMGQLLFNDVIEYFQNISQFRDPANPHRAHSSTRFLDETTYVPSGGTALYDALLTSVTMMLPTLAAAWEMGREVVASVAAVSDGVDEHSRLKDKPELVKKVLDYVLDQALIDKITLVGVGSCDYRAVAKCIGVRDVVQVGGDLRNLRRAFAMHATCVLERKEPAERP